MTVSDEYFLQAERSCSVAPCISYLWQMGAWSACANGASTRSVQCMDIHGNNATDEVPALSQTCSSCFTIHSSEHCASLPSQTTLAVVSAPR